PPRPTLFPYTTLFRSNPLHLLSSFRGDAKHRTMVRNCAPENLEIPDRRFASSGMTASNDQRNSPRPKEKAREMRACQSVVGTLRSEEHTSELQSQSNL